LLQEGLLAEDKVEKIFHRVEGILQCHLIFQVALEERVKNWDKEELIGGSFSEYVST